MPKPSNWSSSEVFEEVYLKLGKCLFDFAVAISALLALFPVLLVIVMLIKIFDPGPVIFKQQRVGRGGQTFTFFKFRSMPVDTKNVPSDQIEQIKLSWVGRLIRRTNLDELPQLFNVLRRDMSIVGPRPAIPSQSVLLEARLKNDATQCLPGLTGLAQISSYDGMPVQEKADLDGKYAGNITFSRDLFIILKTIGYLLKPPPVY